MVRFEWAIATPNTEALRPVENYADAVRQMGHCDQLYQRTVTEIEYDLGGYAYYGDWIPVAVPGIHHCAVCGTTTDLAPGWGFNRKNVYCVDHWCEITEHMQAEQRWQQIHGRAA